jgi:calcium permeable stress-gated cation channel
MAIIMIVMLFITALYQYLLNSAFGPLFRYLPITFEDEAVLRDEAFQRAQDRRLGLAPDDDEATSLTRGEHAARHGQDDDSIELRKLERNTRANTGGSLLAGHYNPVKTIVHAGTWAVRGGKQIRAKTFGKAEENLRVATMYRRQRRNKDLEAQRAIGEALFGAIPDELEDLTPEERDTLLRRAFQHYALRARRPVVWLPRDDFGVSDDECRRTSEFSEHIWISNEGTALDSKIRVVYGRAPPDYSEVDVINL